MLKTRETGGKTSNLIYEFASMGSRTWTKSYGKESKATESKKIEVVENHDHQHYEFVRMSGRALTMRNKSRYLKSKKRLEVGESHDPLLNVFVRMVVRTWTLKNDGKESKVT